MKNCSKSKAITIKTPKIKMNLWTQFRTLAFRKIAKTKHKFLKIKIVTAKKIFNILKNFY